MLNGSGKSRELIEAKGGEEKEEKQRQLKEERNLGVEWKETAKEKLSRSRLCSVLCDSNPLTGLQWESHCHESLIRQMFWEDASDSGWVGGES